MRRALLVAPVLLVLLTGCDDTARKQCEADGGHVETRQTGTVVIDKFPYPIYADYCVKDGWEKPL